MIIFNQLGITLDRKHLVIEASIDTSSLFNDVEIDSVIVDSLDTYVSNGPSSTPIFTYEITKDEVDRTYSIPEECCKPVLEDEDDTYCLTKGDLKVKHIKLLISEEELGISFRNMLFVYVIAKGYPSPDTPCGYDNSKVMGVVVDLYPYYQSMMYGIKELNDTCNVPKYFINNILRFKAVELSIKTGNYILAIKYWKKFFTSDRMRTSYKSCECYGRSD